MPEYRHPKSIRGRRRSCQRGIDQGNCRKSIVFSVLFDTPAGGRSFMRGWRAIPGGFLSLQDIAGFALNAEVS